MSNEETKATSLNDGTQDDWIVTGCFLCYGQCSNVGVDCRTQSDGATGVRPCSKGLAEIMRRRRMRENRPRVLASKSAT